MAKNPNTFQKRQREFNKKRKAEDKRKRRAALKNAPPDQPAEPAPVDEEKTPAVDQA